MNLKKPKEVPAAASDGCRQPVLPMSERFEEVGRRYLPINIASAAVTLIKLTLSSVEEIGPHLQKNDR